MCNFIDVDTKKRRVILAVPDNLPALPTKTFQTPRPLVVTHTFSARPITLAYSIDCFPASAIACTRPRLPVSHSIVQPSSRPTIRALVRLVNLPDHIARPHLTHLPGALLDYPLHQGPLSCRGRAQKIRSHPIGIPIPRAMRQPQAKMPLNTTV
jgi:hypothetical protein